jgi:hypothetical protein
MASIPDLLSSNPRAGIDRGWNFHWEGPHSAVPNQLLVLPAPDEVRAGLSRHSPALLDEGGGEGPLLRSRFQPSRDCGTPTLAPAPLRRFLQPLAFSLQPFLATASRLLRSRNPWPSIHPLPVGEGRGEGLLCTLLRSWFQPSRDCGTPTLAPAPLCTLQHFLQPFLATASRLLRSRNPWPSIHPLPVGEGRGEGSLCTLLRSRFQPSRDCGTPTLAPAPLRRFLQPLAFSLQPFLAVAASALLTLTALAAEPRPGFRPEGGFTGTMPVGDGGPRNHRILLATSKDGLN